MATPAAIIRAARGGTAVPREVEERFDTPEAVALAEGARSWFGVHAGATIFLGPDGARLRSRFGFPDAVAPLDDRYLDLLFDEDGVLIVDDTTSDARFGRAAVDFAGLTVRRLALAVLRGADGEPAAIYCLADPDPSPGFGAHYRQEFAALARKIEETLAADTELDRAVEVQRSLLPTDDAPLPGYRIAGFCLPAREVGGDVFDWYPTPEGLAFTVADVMGKGLGPAIVAAAVRAVLRSAVRKRKPATAVRRLVDALGSDFAASGEFVTLVHGRVRADDGRVRYIDAGHGLAVVVPAAGEHRRLAGEDVPIGIDPEARWAERELVLAPGDTLLVCSDGVLDLADGSLAALDTIADVARRAATVEELVDEVRELAQRAARSDDVTVVAIRRDPTPVRRPEEAT